MVGGYIICGDFEANFPDGENIGTIPIDASISKSDKPLLMGKLTWQDGTGPEPALWTMFPCVMMPVEIAGQMGHSALIYGARNEIPVIGTMALVGSNLVFTPFAFTIS